MNGRVIVGTFVVGMVQTNVYYLHAEGRKETIVFDPADYGGKIFEALDKEGLTTRAVFLTHGHFDHILGVEALCEAAKSRCGSAPPVYACAEEKSLLSDPELNASADYGRTCTVKPDHWLLDKEIVSECGISMQVIHTPGHTEGSCCYYIAQEGPDILIAGDTLFENSVGRTDLPTGSMGSLVRSVKEKLFILPEDTVVYPGHGAPTTIGNERRYNPFVQ